MGRAYEVQQVSEQRDGVGGVPEGSAEEVETKCTLTTEYWRVVKNLILPIDFARTN